jgi:threo-3-hydroxy-L-aspartate ammonia-lyase
VTDAARAAPPVTIEDVRRAATRLQGLVHRTPVLTSRRLDARAGTTLLCKAEHLQRVGAFKFRGATNAIAALDPAVRRRGIVTFSSGNHGQAIACAAQDADVPATIVMPEDAPPVKLAATRGYGAEVHTYDRYTGDRAAIARTIADRTGATIIPPFDDPDVVAGQGTVALELFDQVDDLDVLVVPLGGGGLLAGCAAVASAVSPATLVVGVEPAGRPAGREALRTGRVVEVPVPRTILDGQQTAVIGATPLAVLRDTVHAILGVEDAAVLGAMRSLAMVAKQVVEPSGASALAAVLAGHLGDQAGIDVRGARVGVVLSGGNVTPSVLARAMDVEDRP